MSITALRIVTAATALPISLKQAKAQLRITHTQEDAHIQSLVAAATDWAQTYTRRILVNTNVVVRMDRFPESGDSPVLMGDTSGQWFYVRPSMGRKFSACKRDRAIQLPGGFVAAVNDIDYTDADGAPQTLTGPTSQTPGTDYQEDLTDDEWPLIFPTDNWPGVSSSVVNAVSIDYQVGWPTPDDMPESIRQALKFKVADFYTIRDSDDAGNRSSLLQVAENLLEPYVIPEF